MQQLHMTVREVTVAAEINSYIVDIADATRKNTYLNLGISTRASLALLRIAQASALIAGRGYVIPEDVKSNAILVLSHRITLSSSARANGFTAESIIIDILNTVSVPKVSINV